MKAYLTLDYELFLGKTGTPENCLFVPMNNLLELLDRHEIKCTIFVDAAYLIRLQELKHQFIQLENDYKNVVSHIQMMSSKGHSVQLHIHPQWLYSTYSDDNGWQLDFEHYKLSDLESAPKIQEVVKKSVDILNMITGITVRAYRAGGYSYPVDSDALFESGIRYDSSVLPGVKYISKAQSYDYSNVPQITKWKYKRNPKCIDDKGDMTELPISVMNESFISYIFRRQKYKKLLEGNNGKWGDGVPVSVLLKKKHKIFTKLNKLFRKQQILASIDIPMVLALNDVYKYCCENVKGEEFVIIGHPKNQSLYSIREFEKFILHHSDLEWCTM